MEDGQSKNEGTVQTSTQSNLIDWLAIVRNLSSASDALIAHAKLHERLFELEWEEAKQQFKSMLITFLFGFGCFIVLLLFSGIFVLASSWDTDYRIAAILGLCAVYALMFFLAWQHFLSLSKRSEKIFSSTRTEITADIALLRSRLF